MNPDNNSLHESLRLELSGHPRLAIVLRKTVRQAAKMAGFRDGELNMIQMAVDEAFTNIIRHTYKMDFSQKITIMLTIQESVGLEVKLIDYGPPIDQGAIQGRSLEDVKPGGLGVHFIKNIMDVVEFRSHPKGNVIYMNKYTSEEMPPKGSPHVTQQNDPALLAALLEIGQSLHTILDLDTLLMMVVTKVKDLMNSEGASVMLLDESSHQLFFHTILDEDEKLVSKLKGLRFSADQGIAGSVVKTGEPILVKDVNKNPNHFQKVDEKTSSVTTSLLYAPLKIHNRIIGLLSAKNKKDGQFKQADLQALTAIAGTVTLSIDNARAHQALEKTRPELSETRRIKQELEAARLMHQATLPQQIPEMPGIKVNAICVPATEVGGDYYDFFLLDGKYAIAVGDVSGHGLEAGMMVSMSRSCLYTLTNFANDISGVMKSMSSMVYGSVNKRLMMTFFYGLYDPASKILRFANAGHPSPYHYRKEIDSWSLIEEGEFPLGVFPDYSYKHYSRQLSSGDIIVLYSDGILEAANFNRKRYGAARFKKLLASQQWQTSREIQKAILQDVQNFCEGHPPTDDRTLVILTVE